MHSMPGLPVLHARDLVDRTFQSCALAGRRREPLGLAARSAPRAAGCDVTMRDPFGVVRLEALSAPDVWHAPTALALYAVGPRSTVTVALNVGGLRAGDIAGLALFKRPCAWLGAERGSDGLTVARFDDRAGATSRVRILDLRVWLRAECDFVTNEVVFSYSTDGCGYAVIGQSHTIGGGPIATGGIECALFACSSKAAGRRRPRGVRFIPDGHGVCRVLERIPVVKAAGRPGGQSAAGPVESRSTSSGSTMNSCSSWAPSRFMRQSQIVRPIRSRGMCTVVSAG